MWVLDDPTAKFDPAVSHAVARTMTDEGFLSRERNFEYEPLSYEDGLDEIEAFYGASPRRLPAQPVQPLELPSSVIEPDHVGNRVVEPPEDEFSSLMEDIEQLSRDPELDRYNAHLGSDNGHARGESSAGDAQHLERDDPFLDNMQDLPSMTLSQYPARDLTPHLSTVDTRMVDYLSPSHVSSVLPSSGNKSAMQEEMRDEENLPLDDSPLPRPFFGGVGGVDSSGYIDYTAELDVEQEIHNSMADPAFGVSWATGLPTQPAAAPNDAERAQNSNSQVAQTDGDIPHDADQNGEGTPNTNGVIEGAGKSFEILQTEEDKPQSRKHSRAPSVPSETNDVELYSGTSSPRHPPAKRPKRSEVEALSVDDTADIDMLDASLGSEESATMAGIGSNAAALDKTSDPLSELSPPNSSQLGNKMPEGSVAAKNVYVPPERPLESKSRPEPRFSGAVDVDEDDSSLSELSSQQHSSSPMVTGSAEKNPEQAKPISVFERSLPYQDATADFLNASPDNENMRSSVGPQMQAGSGNAPISTTRQRNDITPDQEEKEEDEDEESASEDNTDKEHEDDVSQEPAKSKPKPKSKKAAPKKTASAKRGISKDTETAATATRKAPKQASNFTNPRPTGSVAKRNTADIVKNRVLGDVKKKDAKNPTIPRKTRGQQAAEEEQEKEQAKARPDPASTAKRRHAK